MNILLISSIINTNLRDTNSTFEDAIYDICEKLNRSYDDVIKFIQDSNYYYNSELNKLIEGDNM